MGLFDLTDSLVSPAIPVSVNGVEISRADIAREIQNHPADIADVALESATRALVIRALLLQEADRLGVTATPGRHKDGSTETEEDARVQALLTQEVTLPEPSSQECQRYYDQHRDRFRSPDLFEVSHILFSADPSDEMAYDGARQRGEQTIRELKSDPARFEELARELSDCPSAAQGGNLGQIGPGQTVREFEDAMAAIAPGGVSANPVESRYGVHVIHVKRKIAGRTLPFEAVSEKIADYLSDRVFHRAVHQYVAILAGRADVQGFELDRAVSPLVQ